MPKVTVLTAAAVTEMIAGLQTQISEAASRIGGVETGLTNLTVRVASLESGAEPLGVTGMMARAYDPTATTAQRDIIDSFVYDPTWKFLQTADGVLTSAGLTEMEECLNWAQTNLGTSGEPLGVRLRVRPGLYAPDFVKTAVGTVAHYVDSALGDGAAAPSNPSYHLVTGGLPKTWDPAYAQLLDEFWVLLEAEFGGHPALREIVSCLPATEFPEIMLRQFGLQENVTNHVNGGWTEAADDQSYRTGVQQILDRWSTPHGVSIYIAHNPPGKVTGTNFTNGNVTRVNTLMDWFFETAGQYAVVGNNSMVAPLSGQSTHYRTMYEYMLSLRARGARLGGQTETLTKILSEYPTETVKGTVEMTRDWGVAGLELPRGCEDAVQAVHTENYITVAYAQLLNPQLRANFVN